MSGNIDDEDDFGEFEEAPVEDSKIENEPINIIEDIQNSHVDNEPIESDIEVDTGTSFKERQESVSQPIDLDILTDLITDENLWNLEYLTVDDQLEKSEQLQSEQVDDNLFDLFSYFYNNLTDSLIPDAQQSIELWRLLQIVEETNALKFRWMSSQLYTNFIDALSFYGSEKLNTTTKICMPKNGDFNINSSNVETSDQQSDWNSATCSTNYDSNLDCDFFQSDSKSNGPSVLEQELNALGLSGQSKNSTPKHTNYPKSNGANHTSPCYLSVSELSVEAQSFYERIPDLRFMLIDRVIRDQQK